MRCYFWYQVSNIAIDTTCIYFWWYVFIHDFHACKNNQTLLLNNARLRVFFIAERSEACFWKLSVLMGVRGSTPGKKLNFKTNGAILDVSENKGTTGQKGKVCPPLPPLSEALPPQSKGRGGRLPPLPPWLRRPCCYGRKSVTLMLKMLETL